MATPASRQLVVADGGERGVDLRFASRTRCWPAPPMPSTLLMRTGPSRNSSRAAAFAHRARSNAVYPRSAAPPMSSAHACDHPSGRGRVARDERMRNGLGRDEGVRHDAAEELVRPADAERRRLRRSAAHRAERRTAASA